MSGATYQHNYMHNSYSTLNLDMHSHTVSTFEAACTTTSAIFSISLTVFTLSALY